MRDGARLYTAVYVPRDESARSPILMYRTRYGVGNYGANVYPPLRELAWPGFTGRPYIFVWQDVRGSFLSEGKFSDMTPHLARKRRPEDVDQSSDTYDTIDWLVANVPGNNGRVGLWGISYDGFFAAAGMIDAHPALVAVSPQAPQADWFGGDDLHMHGALVLDGFEYFSAWGRPRREPTTDEPRPIDFGTADGYEFYLRVGPIANLDERYFRDEIPIWSAVMAHGTYDSFWKERNILPHLVDVRPAVMTVSGWYDANNLYGALHVYQAVERSSPETLNTLVIGPWSHGQWRSRSGESLGDVSFGSATAELYRGEILRPFFDSRLQVDGGHDLPEAYVFETGANRWRTFDHWPPDFASARSLYLQEGGGLSFDPPASVDAYDEYVSDPAKPVPFIERLATDRTHDYMIQDQRFAARRPDVLVYQTDATLRGSDHRGADPPEPLGVDHGNRFRLGGEAHRRLSRRRSRDRGIDGHRTPPSRGLHGGLPAAGARRRAAGQVSREPREARALRAGRAHPRHVRDARCPPYVSEGPPGDGADPELVVSARRPKPAVVRRHLPCPRS